VSGPSITTWTRLTGRSRRADMQPGLLAAVHDPLWLLARQRQLGAFRGEDAPTPVGVAVEVERTKVTRYRPGGPSSTAAARDYDGSIPLETLVEREPLHRDPGANVRLAAETGMRFAAFLAENNAASLADDYAQSYPIDPAGADADAETKRFLQLVARRVADGDKLYEAFHPPGTTPGTVVVPTVPDATGFPGVTPAATDWSAWYETVVSTSTNEDSAWQRERLEYAFALAAPEDEGETVLAAREFGGGRLDWYAFDVASGSLGASGPAPTTVATTVLATPVAFGGMPARRWFEFEDALVNLAKVDAGPPDLARMLLLEYTSLYGNDHFIVPMELEVGSVCRITSLVVTDNFGGRTRVTQAGASGGASTRLFELTGDGAGGAETFLFLAPALANVIEGAPVEEVRFLRDEMANIAWAVERVVESPTGRPLDRYEAYQDELRRNPPVPPAAQTTAPLTYRVQTRVPPHWIPMLPVSVAPGEHAVRLQLREMLDPDTGAPIAPQGALLDTTHGVLELYDEEVPRAGARVRRAYRLARWTDGSAHLWLGRRKSSGRGEGSSGLRFDSVEPTTKAP
jgi:hypothetical protein